MYQSGKRFNDNHDRLSLLPDVILVAILSFLPIKTAAKTTVLCRRWKNLWFGVTTATINFLPPIDGLFNLKTLHLSLALDSFERISNFIRECCSLEDLTLTVDRLIDKDPLNICAPNLKSLKVETFYAYKHHDIVIGAPKLNCLTIRDCGSLYRFSTNPKELGSACIDYRCLPNITEDEGMRGDVFELQLSRFVLGLSSVQKFHLNTNMKLFTTLYALVDTKTPMFPNLTCIKTGLNRSNGIDDVLLFLQSAPNLEDLEVTLDYGEGSPLNNLPANNIVLYNLRTVKISGLRGNILEIEIIRYILRNGVGLKQLRIEVCIDQGVPNKDCRVGKEYLFCEACFNLPRSSSVVDIWFSGEYINAANNALYGIGRIHFFI